METNEKGRSGWHQATPKDDTCGFNHTPIIRRIKSAVSSRIWALQYALEEGRMRYASQGKLIRQAWACIALAIMQAVGVRYA
jgi:hypothetical protein